jgi:hypothetical protein
MRWKKSLWDGLEWFFGAYFYHVAQAMKLDPSPQGVVECDDATIEQRFQMSICEFHLCLEPFCEVV